MRQKQQWMFKGAIVLANGKKATIEKMQTNTIDRVEYVYYIDVKLEA